METENTFKVVTREDKLKGLLLLSFGCPVLKTFVCVCPKFCLNEDLCLCLLCRIKVPLARLARRYWTALISSLSCMGTNFALGLRIGRAGSLSIRRVSSCNGYVTPIVMPVYCTSVKLF